MPNDQEQHCACCRSQSQKRYAKSLTPEDRTARAKHAVNTRWARVRAEQAAAERKRRKAEFAKSIEGAPTVPISTGPDAA